MKPFNIFNGLTIDDLSEVEASKPTAANLTVVCTTFVNIHPLRSLPKCFHAAKKMFSAGLAFSFPIFFYPKC